MFARLVAFNMSVRRAALSLHASMNESDVTRPQADLNCPAPGAPSRTRIAGPATGQSARRSRGDAPPSAAARPGDDREDG